MRRSRMRYSLIQSKNNNMLNDQPAAQMNDIPTGSPMSNNKLGVKFAI